MSQEAMKLALEALEKADRHCSVNTEAEVFVRLSITALREALAQQALDKKAENARELGLDYEPVGEAYLCDKCQTPFDGAWECPNCGHRSATKESVYTTPPAQEFVCSTGLCHYKAQPTLKPLTNEQVGKAARDAHIAFCLNKHQTYEHALTRAVEVAHGITGETK